jgi:diaminopimelate decarboxylase
MDHFLHRAGVLHAEDVSVADVAEAVGTPFYLYSTATLVRHWRLFDEALAWAPRRLVCFAVKACGNVAVLRTLAAEGSGMDVVSGGELARALAAGVPGERIVFSGVGKTRAEMRAALEARVRQFNVESEPELAALSEVAASMGAVARIAMRVNPDVDAGTHDKIATGRRGDKFGVPIEAAPDLYDRAAALPGIEAVGVDVHIGSQISDLAPFEAAYGKVAELTRALRARGHAISRLDLGGGLGIPYARSNAVPPPPAEYGAMVRRAVGDLGCEVDIEPGRLIAGNAGVLVSRVIYVKDGEPAFLILDAAMNDLLRPAMYGAHHDIVPVQEADPGAALSAYDVVGPVCESGDTFARARDLPPLSPGALVAFRTAGAYGAVMASEYNARPLVPEVLVRGDRWGVIRPRPSVEEMLGRERLPDWLEG